MAASADESKYEGGQTRIIQNQESCEAKSYLRYSHDFEKELLKPKT
jgi:hypothetical protein